ncbi:MAG TPA: hypothetical protein VGH73_01385 [Thermoanaerobaculia bacterium]|jgi:hypothetical protein
MSETHTKTGEGVLVDEVRESPVDRVLLRHHRWLLLALLVIVLLVAASCWFRDRQESRPDAGARGYSARVEAPAGEGATV